MNIKNIVTVTAKLICVFVVAYVNCWFSQATALLSMFQELMGTFDAAGRNVEVAFCFDTTGSMYSCLDTVSSRQEVSSDFSENTCRKYVKLLQFADEK